MYGQREAVWAPCQWAAWQGGAVASVIQDSGDHRGDGRLVWAYRKILK